MDESDLLSYVHGVRVLLWDQGFCYSPSIIERGVVNGEIWLKDIKIGNFLHEKYIYHLKKYKNTLS